MKRIVLLLLTFSSLHAADQPHITALAIQGEYVLTGDADGQTKLWTKKGNLLNSLALATHPVELIAVHPYESVVAVTANKVLHVWNWETESELYRLELHKQLFSLEFSPSGRYLLYSDPALTVIVALSGSPAPVLQEYTPSADFFLLSSSEKNIMEYSASRAEITYREFHTGTEIQRISAPGNLRDFILLSNRRHALALTSKQLVLLDILTGTLLHTYPLSADDLFFAEERIIAIKRNQKTTQIWTFRNLDNSLYLQNSQSFSLSVSAATSSSNALLLGTADGTLYTYDADKETLHPLSIKHLTSVEEFAATDTEVFFTAAGNLFRLFLTTQEYQLLYENTPLRIIHSPEGPVFLTTERKPIQHLQIVLPDPQKIKTASAVKQHVLLQYHDGLLELRGATGNIIFTYAAGLIENSLYIPERKEIIIGQPNTTFLGSSLYRVNIDTTETVPIANSFFYIMDLFFAKNTLWVLGLQKEQEVTTRLLAFPNLSRSWQLARIPGESLNSSFLKNSPNTVPSLVGTGNTPIYWTGRQDDARSISQKLRHSLAAISAGDFLITKQVGGNLAVFDERTLRLLFEIYVIGSRSVEIR